MTIRMNEEPDYLDHHLAWCAECREPVDVDDDGGCVNCRDNGDHGVTEPIVEERVPETSPRSIECPTCGEDIGTFCHKGEDGNGWNHAARVERVDAEHGVLR